MKNIENEILNQYQTIDWKSISLFFIDKYKGMIFNNINDFIKYININDFSLFRETDGQINDNDKVYIFYSRFNYENSEFNSSKNENQMESMSFSNIMYISLNDDYTIKEMYTNGSINQFYKIISIYFIKGILKCI